MLCLYGDDILIFGANMKGIHEVKSFLSKSFDIEAELWKQNLLL
jgi:hypothetical protein